jgi:RNA polymerase sigma-70 factor (ECF subfamily)
MSTAVSAVAITRDYPAKTRGAHVQPDLVARAQAGDGEAFAVLFEQHKKRVYSLCLLMTGDVADAEDLTQDAFIQVFRKLGTFRGDSAFSTWLYRVAVNTVLMSLRKRKPRQVSLDEPVRIEHSLVPRDFGKDDPGLSGTVDRIALIRAIKELPEGYRKIFLLHEVEGYQHHEIASLLRCSVGNSKSQLHKAKLKIRELLLDKSATAEEGEEGRTKPETAFPAAALTASRRKPEHDVAPTAEVCEWGALLEAQKLPTQLEQRG